MGRKTFALRPDTAAWLRSVLAEGASPASADPAVAPLLRERLVLDVARPRARVGAVKAICASALVERALRRAERARSRPGRARRLLHVARGATAVFGWAETVRVWERHYRQPSGAPPPCRQDLEVIDETVRLVAARSLAGHECKERALACLALARSSGVAAELVVGISEPPLRAHVWVEAGGTVVSDDADSCRRYDRVARYTGTGTLVPP